LIKKLYILTLLSALSITANANETNQSWYGKYYGIAFTYNHATADNQSNIIDGNYYTGDDNALVSPHANKNTSKNIAGATLSLGYNKQDRNIVYGLEADLSLAKYEYNYNSGNIEYNTVPGTTFNIKSSLKHDWLINIQPKVGYILNSNLYYITAGISLAQFKYKFQKTDTAFNINFQLSNEKIELDII